MDYQENEENLARFLVFRCIKSIISERIYIIYLVGYFFVKIGHLITIYVVRGLDGVILTLPENTSIFLIAILEVLLIQLGMMQIKKFDKYDPNNPFKSLFGNIETKLQIANNETVEMLQKRGFEIFRKYLHEKMRTPRIKLIIYFYITAVHVDNIRQGFFGDWLAYHEFVIHFQDAPLLLTFPQIIFGKIFSVVFNYLLIGFTLLCVLQLVRTLKSMSSNPEILKTLTITHLDELMEPFNQQFGLNSPAPDATSQSSRFNTSPSEETISINPMFLEFHANFTLRAFKHNAAPMARLSLLLALLIMFGTIILNLYMVLSFLPNYSPSGQRSFTLFLILGDFSILIILIGAFFYPQLAVHDILEQGKRKLLRRLEGIYQYLLAKMLTETRNGNFVEASRLVPILSEFNNVLGRLDSILTWPFNYRQIIALVGSLVASSFTIISLLLPYLPGL